MIIKEFYLDGIAATRTLARKIAAELKVGDIIALYGNLGAGKTEFCRAIIHGLGYDEDVPSPTFSLLQIYEPPISDMTKLAVWHCDLYRLEEPEEVYELGLEDGYDSAITLIEWPDRMGELLPSEHLKIELFMGTTDGSREIKIKGGKEWNARLKELSL